MEALQGFHQHAIYPVLQMQVIAAVCICHALLPSHLNVGVVVSSLAMSVAEQVHMYHGAMLAAIVNIAQEGFDLSACGGRVYVSNRR